MTDRENRRNTGNPASRQDIPDDDTSLARFGALTLDMAEPSQPKPSPTQYRQIVFIEGNVPDARQLAAGAAAGTLAVILDPSADGMTQIAAFLTDHNAGNLAAIDIVAHGADGTVQLGTGALDAATLGSYQTELATIGAALQPGGAIRIYGCDVAQDPAGVAFTDRLSAAAGGANIAAASHLVGATSGGGSWNLDVNTGSIDAGSPLTATAEAAYPAELSAGTSQLFLAFNVNNTNGGASIDQIPVNGSSITSSVTTLTNSSDLSTGQGVLDLVVEDPQNRYFVVDDDAALGRGTVNQILVGTFGTNALAAPSYLNFNNSSSISPWGIAESANPNFLYMANYDAADPALNGIWSINVNTGAAAPVAVSSSVIGPDNIALDQQNNLAFFTDTFGSVSQIDVGDLSTGAVQILYTTNNSEWLYGIAANAGTLYFDAGNAASVDGVYDAAYTVSGGVVSLGAVNTLYSIALNTSVTPTSLAIDPLNGVFYIGDEDNAGSTWNVWEGSLAGSAVQPNLVEVAAIPTPYTGAAPDTDALTLMSTPTIVTGGTLAYIGGTSDPLDPGVTVANPDGQGIAGATVRVLGGTGNDILTANVSGTSISASYSAATETLTLSGADTAADYQTVLADVAFSTTGPNGIRTVDWSVTDGIIPSDTSASSVAVVCFCAGTRIGTPDGEVPIEMLKIGDKVLTVDNGPRPVVWIGRGKVLATRGRRTAATPVIILKGALADNVPNRDLHVTKAHGIYIDHVLIPVEFLVNHRSILWDDRAREVEIYHVELDSHDVLLANGAWAETYRDDGNRWLFQNGNPGWKAPVPEPYAPVLTGGPLVDAAWMRLLRRAGPRSLPPMTEDPDLHLLVDGRRVDAVEADGQVRTFRLSCKPQTIQIVSRDAVPAELGIARDPRSLGVALRWLMLRSGPKFEVFLASDARLTFGFHAFEADGNLRWTDGCATLPIEPLARFTGGIEVAVCLAGTTKYPDHGAVLAQAAA